MTYPLRPSNEVQVHSSEENFSDRLIYGTEFIEQGERYLAVAAKTSKVREDIMDHSRGILPKLMAKVPSFSTIPGHEVPAFLLALVVVLRDAKQTDRIKLKDDMSYRKIARTTKARISFFEQEYDIFIEFGRKLKELLGLGSLHLAKREAAYDRVVNEYESIHGRIDELERGMFRKIVLGVLDEEEAESPEESIIVKRTLRLHYEYHSLLKDYSAQVGGALRKFADAMDSLKEYSEIVEDILATYSTVHAAMQLLSNLSHSEMMVCFRLLNESVLVPKGF